MDRLPILGVTMGDICGIGPEITVRALSKAHAYEVCKPVIIGSYEAVIRAKDLLSADVEVSLINDIKDAKFQYGTIDVYDVPLDIEDINKVPYGEVINIGGDSAFYALKKVIELALNNEIDGTITGPLNKESLNLAGHHFNGHTEIYAHYTETKDYAMMLADGNLRVVHVSTHVPLRESCDRVTKERVYNCIYLAKEACASVGIENPNIAVAGLNPHAGENGLFGREEIEEIIPAIEKAKSEGLNVKGPEAPDTVFSKALGGMYDIVVVMYHDQGHIPVKVKGFVYDHEEKMWKNVEGVNITLGLPIIRVSVDHGTAFDQAGKGTASSDSLENAIDYGSKMATNRIKERRGE